MGTAGNNNTNTSFVPLNSLVRGRLNLEEIKVKAFTRKDRLREKNRKVDF